jgi:hypothetical protein
LRDQKLEWPLKKIFLERGKKRRDKENSIKKGEKRERRGEKIRTIGNRKSEMFFRPLIDHIEKIVPSGHCLKTQTRSDQRQKGSFSQTQTQTQTEIDKEGGRGNVAHFVCIYPSFI